MIRYDIFSNKVGFIAGDIWLVLDEQASNKVSFRVGDSFSSVSPFPIYAVFFEIDERFEDGFFG